jgi:hypothetical protein
MERIHNLLTFIPNRLQFPTASRRSYFLWYRRSGPVIFVLVFWHPYAPYKRASSVILHTFPTNSKSRHSNKAHPFFTSPSRLLRSRPTFNVLLHGMASHTPTHLAGCQIVPPAYQPFEAATTSALIISRQRHRMPHISFLIASRGHPGTANCLFSFLYTQILVLSSELVLD